MSKRLLDHDPLTGMKVYHEFDASTGKSTIETVQDIEPYLNRSKILADSLNKKEDWWYIGTIPDIKVLQWAKECGHRPYTKGWSEYARKQLNLAENRKLNPNKIRL